ncbi:unnamed protein product [Albugo candida]|uniref:Uncharacterized protein n=1 Tax=Albugo candida TaxID=65357 RepID=A0A024GHD5_9STRA|nr:unnamed protein product [Albugo candida]|eukprot:CCI46184.1 unnamed protein product [Albugo candida]
MLFIFIQAVPDCSHSSTNLLKFQEMFLCIPFHPESVHLVSFVYDCACFANHETFRFSHVSSVLVAEQIRDCNFGRSMVAIIAKALTSLTFHISIAESASIGIFIASIWPWNFFLASLINVLIFQIR